MGTEKIVLRPLFKMHQTVFHITPGSDPGVILDWRYNRMADFFEYYVSTGYANNYWCIESELTTEKIYNII
jgi:hypothetical protein